MVTQNTKNTVCYFLKNDLIVFAFLFIPFLTFSPVAAGVITLVSLVSICVFFLKGARIEQVRWNPISLAILAFMVFSAISSLFVVDEMKSYVRLMYEIRLPMILFSISFLFRGIHGFDCRRALLFFALGACASSLVVVLVFIHSLFTAFDNISYSFFNIQLCFQSILSMISHRTYICFNLITALVIFYYLYSSDWSREKIVRFLLLASYVASFVFLTEARISLLTLVWVVLFVVSRELRRYWSSNIYILCVVIICVASFFVIFQNARVNNFLLSFFSDPANLKELDPRFNIWSCGWNSYCASSFPWIGAGTGSASEILNEEYRRTGFSQALDYHWEMHNQFLEVLLENGILGLTLFLVMLFLPIFLKNKLRLLYAIWIPALCLNLFFESMLSRSIGTYPIVSILILSGIADEKGKNIASGVPMKFFLSLTFVAVLAVSVKYMMKDKRDEFSGFQRFFERVDELPGDVPDEISGCYGLKIDNRTKASKWTTWATMYQCFERHSFNRNETFYFSLYVYVSEDFNADLFTISYEERQKNAQYSYYDLERKGTWQKLELSGGGLNGNTIFLTTCSKNNCSDFSGLEGYAIFVNPTIEIKEN